MYNYEIFVITIISILIFLIPFVFFILTQQRTLQQISETNRYMQPGQVWLQLIPIFGTIYQFIVISRLSDSIRAELADKNKFDFEGNEVDPYLEQSYERPTYNIGIAYCSLILASVLPIPVFNYLFTIAGLICWIIYWIKLAGYKKQLQQKKLAFA